MKRSEQGGAIVGFLIASVVLALLLVGGVYAIHHHPDWVASTSSPSVSAPGSSHTDTSSKPQNPDSSKPDDTNKDKDTTPAPTSNGSSTDNGSSSTTPSTSSTETTPAPTVGTPDNSSVSGQSTGTLPQTGPADTVWSILGVGFVTVAAAAYIRSRRLV